MEQELRFELDLGRSATFEAGFFMSVWGFFFKKHIVDGENIFGIE